MATAVENLETWFRGLSTNDKEDVVKFLYGNRSLILKGVYTGPVPGLVTRGLFAGTAPREDTSRCSMCGRPL